LAPLNLNPNWKEVLSFDITRPEDEVSIMIVNNYQNHKEILAEKVFVMNEVGNDQDDPLHELKD
jgi:hypothetical protein